MGTGDSLEASNFCKIHVLLPGGIAAACGGRCLAKCNLLVVAIESFAARRFVEFVELAQDRAC